MTLVNGCCGFGVGVGVGRGRLWRLRVHTPLLRMALPLLGCFMSPYWPVGRSGTSRRDLDGQCRWFSIPSSLLGRRATTALTQTSETTDTARAQAVCSPRGSRKLTVLFWRDRLRPASARRRQPSPNRPPGLPTPPGRSQRAHREGVGSVRSLLGRVMPVHGFGLSHRPRP